jgi:predicted ATPase
MRRLDVPIVGREEEIALLRHAFDRVVEERSCRLVTLVGPAGIGKTRLAAELMFSLKDRATTAVGSCPAYGEGLTFWPLRRLLRGLGGEAAFREALAGRGESETVLELLRGLIGAREVGASTEDMFWAVRRSFEALGHRWPLVLCFEDLHWAEPTLLDLVEYLVGWSRQAPILLLVLARPELVERRPGWVAPNPNTDALALGPLSRGQTESLLAGLSAERSFAAEDRERIFAAAEGNPLFVEQMTAMAAEQDGESELSIPPSIQALLAERLDRLTPEEREVVERASVVGRDFPLAAVAGLFPPEQRQALATHLFGLVRKGLVRPDRRAASEEDRFSFQHVLVRDAAYEAMPKEVRATLHERFAEWLEALEEEQELEELVAYHLEQAHRYRIEIGVFGEHTEMLAARAVDRLASGAIRARGRNDLHAALNLLRRAAALSIDESAAVALGLDLTEVVFLSGQLDKAIELADETAARASAVRDEVGELRARVWRARIATHVPRGETGAEGAGEVLAVAERARLVFARHGHDLALTEAWFAAAWGHLMRCRFTEMLEALEHAAEHARRAGSTRWEGEMATWQGTAMFYGPTPVDDVLRWYAERRPQHPIALTQHAMLEAMRGNFDLARKIAGSARTTAEEFGQTLWLHAGGMAVCEIELLAGNPARAEAAVRPSCERLEELGEEAYRWNAVGQLAASLYALDRLDEAAELARAAESDAPKDDVASQILWRQVLAKVLARRAEHDEAEQLAREALSVVERTDMLNYQANVLADLAEVYSLTGRWAEAFERLKEAAALYDRKGNLVGSAKARERVDDMKGGPVPDAGP